MVSHDDKVRAQCAAAQDGLLISARWLRELLEQARTGDALTVRLSGAWRIDNIAAIEAALAQLQEGARRLVVDAGSLEALDLSGAWLLRERLHALQDAGSRIEFAGEPPSQFAFIDEITEQQAGRSCAVEPEPPGRCTTRSPGSAAVSVQQLHQAIDALGYLGRIAVTGAALAAACSICACRRSRATYTRPASRRSRSCR